MYSRTCIALCAHTTVQTVQTVPTRHTAVLCPGVRPVTTDPPAQGPHCANHAKHTPQLPGARHGARPDTPHALSLSGRSRLWLPGVVVLDQEPGLWWWWWLPRNRHGDRSSGHLSDNHLNISRVPIPSPFGLAAYAVFSLSTIILLQLYLLFLSHLSYNPFPLPAYALLFFNLHSPPPPTSPHLFRNTRAQDWPFDTRPHPSNASQRQCHFASTWTPFTPLEQDSFLPDHPSSS